MFRAACRPSCIAAGATPGTGLPSCSTCGEVADDEDLGVAGDGQVGLDQRRGPRGRAARRASGPAARRRRPPPRAPSARWIRSAPIADAVGVDPRDLRRRSGPRRRAARAAAGPSPRGRRRRPAARAAPPSTRITRAEAGSMWRKSRASVVPRDLGQRAGQLDAGRARRRRSRTSARPAAAPVVRLALGGLEGQQDPPADLAARPRWSSGPGACSAHSSWPK